MYSNIIIILHNIIICIISVYYFPFSIYTVWLKCHDSSIATKLGEFVEFITKMINGKTVKVTSSDEEIPRDCAITTVGSDVEVHLLLKVCVCYKVFVILCLVYSVCYIVFVI